MPFPSSTVVARVLLFVALFATIFGAKLQLIERYGSDLPYWDQWDAEGETLLETAAAPQSIFRPHNEHRPVFTRILARTLLVTNEGQWDCRVQLLVNALLHTTLAALLLGFALRVLPFPAAAGFAALLFLFFSMNVSWENTLVGFQSQFYFLGLFSLLHFAGSLLARPRSLGWWLAPLAGIGALFSMASGLLSAFAILAVTVLRAGRDRRFTKDDGFVVFTNAGLMVAGWLLKVEKTEHAALKATSVANWFEAWLHQLTWPVASQGFPWAAVIGLAPPVALLVAYARRKIDGPFAVALLAACVWNVLQAAAIAYARGAGEPGFSSRYTDILAIGLLINLLAVAFLVRHSDTSRLRWGWGGFATLFVVLSVWGLARESTATRHVIMDGMPAVNAARIENVRSYLVGANPGFTGKIPWSELPYPSGWRLARLLDEPAIRSALPASVRPPFALTSETLSTRGFERTGSGVAPVPALPDRMVWSSSASGPGHFRSERFTTDRSRVSLLLAGTAPAQQVRVRLIDNYEVQHSPDGEIRTLGPAWTRITFSVPPGKYRLDVDKPAGGWLAFSEPATDTPLSQFTLGAVTWGPWFLGGGAMLGLVALAWCRFGSSSPTASKNGRGIVTALVALTALTVAASLGTQGDTGGDHDLFEALAAFLLNGCLLGALWLVFARLLHARSWVGAVWVPLVAGGAVAVCGYVAFWIYWLSPFCGKIFSWALFSIAIWAAIRTSRKAELSRETLTVPLLQLGIGVLYLGLLYLVPAKMDFYDHTAHRFYTSLPADDRLPYELAARLYHDKSPKPFFGDWLSSDRPPLQSGWQLLAWPLTALPRMREVTASGTAALWFQLLWVAAAYGLFRVLGLGERRAAAWIVVLASSAFFLLHTVFVWPKLAAGALAVGAFALWLLPGAASNRWSGAVVGAALAALAWLAHGGVAFSFLPLGLVVAWRVARGGWREWGLAAAVFAVVVLPWTAYQKFYDPPGNRLLKWHLAGQVPVDGRGTWETLRESYRSLSWSQIAANKSANLRTQFAGNWRNPADFSPATARSRRTEEFFFTARTLTWWAGGLALLPLAFLRESARQRFKDNWRAHAALTVWVAATILVWCLLIFAPNQAIVHQGSFAAMIALFVLLSAWIELAGAGLIFAVLALQAATLLSTWTAANEVISGPINGAAMTVAVLSATALLMSFAPARAAAPPTPPVSAA